MAVVSKRKRPKRDPKDLRRAMQKTTRISANVYWEVKDLAFDMGVTMSDLEEYALHEFVIFQRNTAFPKDAAATE